MNALLEEIYRSGTVAVSNGAAQALHSNIDRREGEFLLGLIAADPSICQTLEVGCAYGISSLVICEGIEGRPNAHHTAIDPFQNSQWDSIGVKNVEKAGYPFFSLIEHKSEFALPELLSRQEEAYDLILVDGFHTFDHTMIDCFYAARLLRIGGYLVVDDVLMPGVGRAVQYLWNYPCFAHVGSVSDRLRITLKRSVSRLLVSPLPHSLKRSIFSMAFQEKLFSDEQTRMVALRKISRDERPWDWYSPRF